jgi:hypothetical protein
MQPGQTAARSPQSFVLVLCVQTGLQGKRQARRQRVSGGLDARIWLFGTHLVHN